MKRMVVYLGLGALFAAAGGVCLAIGRMDRGVADAAESVLAQKYDDSDAQLATAERYLGYASALPWVGNGPVNDVRSRRAAVRYWQGDYAALIPQQTDPLAAIPSDNVDLQFVVANAIYRIGQIQAKDKPAMIDALNRGISAYATVLRNSVRHDDAASNFEYLVRQRDEVEKGRKPPAGRRAGLLGAAGYDQQRGEGAVPFRLYVPLEQEERLKDSKAGKAPPKPRKG